MGSKMDLGSMNRRSSAQPTWLTRSHDRLMRAPHQPSMPSSESEPVVGILSYQHGNKIHKYYRVTSNCAWRIKSRLIPRRKEMVWMPWACQELQIPCQLTLPHHHPPSCDWRYPSTPSITADRHKVTRDRSQGTTNRLGHAVWYAFTSRPLTETRPVTLPTLVTYSLLIGCSLPMAVSSWDRLSISCHPNSRYPSGLDPC